MYTNTFRYTIQIFSYLILYAMNIDNICSIKYNIRNMNIFKNKNIDISNIIIVHNGNILKKILNLKYTIYVRK